MKERRKGVRNERSCLALIKTALRAKASVGIQLILPCGVELTSRILREHIKSAKTLY